MDIPSLQAFLAVAQWRSFSLAAQHLHLTQPAISKRIANLEHQLGHALFDRIGRQVTLTEAGHALQPRAQAIVLALEDSKRALNNLSGQVSGALTLATSHHIGLHRLPPLLKTYTQTYPQVKLDLRFLDSEQAYEGVLQGELELAVVTLAPNPSPALIVEPVWWDRLHFVVAREHPLASQAQVFSLQDLTAYDAVLPGHQTFTRGIVEAEFAQQGLPLNVALSTNYLETLKMMVSIGLGWSVLPETLIDASMQALQVQHTPLRRPLGYLYHNARTLSNAAQSMLSLLQQEAQQAP